MGGSQAGTFPFWLPNKKLCSLQPGQTRLVGSPAFPPHPRAGCANLSARTCPARLPRPHLGRPQPARPAAARPRGMRSARRARPRPPRAELCQVCEPPRGPALAMGRRRLRRSLPSGAPTSPRGGGDRGS